MSYTFNKQCKLASTWELESDLRLSSALNWILKRFSDIIH